MSSLKTHTSHFHKMRSAHFSTGENCDMYDSLMILRQLVIQASKGGQMDMASQEFHLFPTKSGSGASVKAGSVCRFPQFSHDWWDQPPPAYVNALFFLKSHFPLFGHSFLLSPTSSRTLLLSVFYSGKANSSHQHPTVFAHHDLVLFSPFIPEHPAPSHCAPDYLDPLQSLRNVMAG